MLREFLLPDLGEGLTESELVAWRVGVGDRIELNQVIADVETAKAVVELPSPFAGTIAALHAEAGETIIVGAPLVAFEVEGAEPNLVGYGARAESTLRRRRVSRDGTGTGTAAETPPVPGAAVPAATERPRSSPPVRRLARDLGIDLTSLHGTGDRGKIVRADLPAASSSVSAPPPHSASGRAPATTSPEGVRRVPITGVRKATAAAMVASAFTAPHVTEFLTVDVTATIELIARLMSDREFAGHRITPLTICAKAVCIALARTPSLNSRWDDTAQEIVEFDSVNLGIAAATDRGLVVPNIKNANALDLMAMADALGELSSTARAGTTSPVELRGGTFTITNIGVFGIDAGTPILNPGEAGILALGAVHRMPWE
ncbi:MAG: 2-oxo acid dehydrogenase subunit E2, partial [Actinomycetota bacterium]|nr:2-oxo acid dehydrogenase subunit E2 [Actinomycetota bacterium]